MSKNYHYLFKYIVAGDAGTGKSTLIQQFTQESHANTYASTQRIHFASKTITVNELQVRCQVWDMKQPTESQKGEGFTGLADSLCKKAAAVFLVFDLGNKSSFDGLEHWVQDIRVKCDENISIILVGNKVDRQARVVSAEYAQQFSKKTNIPYFEISSFDLKAVSLLFQGVTKIILDKINTQIEARQTSKLKSRIKRGKMEIQTRVSAFESSNEERQKERLQIQQTKIQDSDQIFSIMEKMTESLKKVCLIEQALKTIKSNIRQKGIYYLRQIKNQLQSSRIAQSSSVVKDLFEIFSIIQEFSSQQHMTLSRISLQNEELSKYKEVKSQMLEDKKKIQQLQKKIQSITLQKSKLQQYKENSEFRQQNLLQIIDKMKKERKAESQKNNKLQQSLSKLQQQNLQLAKQISRYKQQQEEINVQRLIQARQNSEIIDQLQTLQSHGLQSEILGKLRKKFSVNSSIRASQSEICEKIQ